VAWPVAREPAGVGAPSGLLLVAREAKGRWGDVGVDLLTGSGSVVAVSGDEGGWVQVSALVSTLGSSRRSSMME
jgi:hypothetical protein